MNTTLTSNTRDEVLSTLNSLIEINRDGQEGFSQSSEHATDPGLKELFGSYSAERATFAGELRQLQRDHGQAEADDSGSITGTLHRAWINLRTALSSRDDLAILEEAERGEDAAVAAYRDALQPADGTPFPRSVTAVLEHQFGKILSAHNAVRQRRDAARAAAKAA